MARGKTPRRGKRARTEDLPGVLDTLRRATLNVHASEGRLIAARAEQTELAQRAYAAGATHKEIAAACRHRWAPGRPAPALRRKQR